MVDVSACPCFAVLAAAAAGDFAASSVRLWSVLACRADMIKWTSQRATVAPYDYERTTNGTSDQTNSPSGHAARNEPFKPICAPEPRRRHRLQWRRWWRWCWWWWRMMTTALRRTRRFSRRIAWRITTFLRPVASILVGHEDAIWSTTHTHTHMHPATNSGVRWVRTSPRHCIKTAAYDAKSTK